MLSVPKELSGETKKMVSVGKDQKYYVDPKNKKAVREFRKQLGVYTSKKKILLTKTFPWIWRFLPFELVNTSAALIYRGTNLKLFDFDKVTVTTVFRDQDTMTKNVKWLKKLGALDCVVDIISTCKEEKTITAKYLDFEILQLKNFLIHVKDVVEINNRLGKAKKTVRLADFTRALPEGQRELLKRRIKELGISEKTIPLAVSHGDFHPGNLPRYGLKFYLLDFDSVDMRPKIFDFAYFSFVPAHFNMAYAKTGMRLFKKFLNFVDVSPIELVASLSMIRSSDKKFQNFFEENGLFLEYLEEGI